MEADIQNRIDVLYEQLQRLQTGAPASFTAWLREQDTAPHLLPAKTVFSRYLATLREHVAINTALEREHGELAQAARDMTTQDGPAIRRRTDVLLQQLNEVKAAREFLLQTEEDAKVAGMVDWHRRLLEQTGSELPESFLGDLEGFRGALAREVGGPEPWSSQPGKYIQISGSGSDLEILIQQCSGNLYGSPGTVVGGIAVKSGKKVDGLDEPSARIDVQKPPMQGVYNVQYQIGGSSLGGVLFTDDDAREVVLAYLSRAAHEGVTYVSPSARTLLARR